VSNHSAIVLIARIVDADVNSFLMWP